MNVAVLFRCSRVVAAVASLAALLVTNAGCSSHGGSPRSHPDGGAAGHGGSGGPRRRRQADRRRPDQAVSTCGVTGPKIATGNSCGCDAECVSGHCVEGVCCATACSGGCATCSAPGPVGTCVDAAGRRARPRTAATCPADSPASCGLDGLCDGAGGCRKYLGNTCMNGTCSGDAVVGAFACDGNGQCKPGVSLMLCIPYTCNPATGSCYQSCDSAAMCQSGGVVRLCDRELRQGPERPALHEGQRLHLRPLRRQGLLQQRLHRRLHGLQPARPPRHLPARRHGQARPARHLHGPGRRQLRPHRHLRRRRRLRELHARHAVPDAQLHGQPAEHGGHLRRPRDLPRARRAELPPLPLRRRAPARTSCETDKDCDDGAICQNGTCGPKPPGFPCGGAAECASGFCVDGVCCETACSGTCHSCALPGSPGRCLTVAADNVDPRGECKDNGAAACGTNGKCDGTGSCEKYAVGHAVREREVQQRRLHPARRPATPPASASPPTRIPARPYVCNGTPVLQHLRDERPVQAAEQLRLELVRAEGSAGAVLQRRRVRHRLLLAGRLLQLALRRQVPVVRARPRRREPARTCRPAPSTRPPPAWTRGPAVAARTASVTATGPASCTRRGRPAWARRARRARPPSRACRPATARASA